MKQNSTPAEWQEIDWGEAITETPRSYIWDKLRSINYELHSAAKWKKLDGSMFLKLEAIRNLAQSAIDMLNRIDGARKHEYYNNEA